MSSATDLIREKTLAWQNLVPDDNHEQHITIPAEVHEKSLAWIHGFIFKYTQQILDTLNVTGISYQYIKFTLREFVQVVIKSFRVGSMTFMLSPTTTPLTGHERAMLETEALVSKKKKNLKKKDRKFIF
eukprot:TRINITY_DN5051_c0_g2_i2.p1 TRINITY_DN5051_c0_g2~~TRINITY_DN5051_c0_g2_i2.p1  ORF type:complete len:148 (-),score=13.08 TRINITY_DN5051_c0_g2_i2:243-629(-)